MSDVHVADTGLFVAMGRPSNRRYRAVRSFARRNEVTFCLPERVYDELATEDPEVPSPPVDAAIDEGWVDVADPLDYTVPLVSKAMDGVQRYVADADDRPADEVERADAALAGLAAQALATGVADQAYVYTTDVAAGEGAEAVLDGAGYGDSITFVDGFRFVEGLLE